MGRCKQEVAVEGEKRKLDNEMSSKLVFPCNVEVSGSWTEDWKRQPCKLNSDGMFEVELDLSPGIYEYKFLVNGVWSLDQTKPSVRNAFGGENNVLIVEKCFNSDVCGENPDEVKNECKTEPKKVEKKCVTFVDTKENIPYYEMNEGFGTTSFNSILKQFGRHNIRSVDRKVRNIEEDGGNFHPIKDEERLFQDNNNEKIITDEILDNSCNKVRYANQEKTV